MPEISVIIPVYKAERYLSRCLDSIICQSFSDFEVICVDDGSPDNSLLLLEQYAQADARIKYVQQKNSGVSVARNYGLSFAKGKYICFVDADDAIEPQTFEIALNAAKRNDAALVIWNFSRSNGEIQPSAQFDILSLKEKVINNPLFLGHRGKLRVSFNVLSKLFRKDIIEGISFLPEMFNYQDFPYVYAVLARRPRTVMLDVPLSCYTINPDSISHLKINPRQIGYYHTGLSFVCRIYEKPEMEKERDFILKDLLPPLLRKQYRLCRKSDQSVREEMYKFFAAELSDFKKRGLLKYLNIGFFAAIRYERIIKKYIC